MQTHHEFTAPFALMALYSHPLEHALTNQVAFHLVLLVILHVFTDVCFCGTFPNENTASCYVALYLHDAVSGFKLHPDLWGGGLELLHNMI